MTGPITSLPETFPSNPNLNVEYKELLNELCQAIKDINHPELTPLLKIFAQVPDDDDRARLAFSSMFECIQQRKDFDKLFDDDVPNQVKPFIEAYANPKDHVDQPKQILQENLTFAPPTALNSESLSSAVKGLIVSPTPDGGARGPVPAFQPLPTSPHARHTALKIVKNLEDFDEVKEADGKPMRRLSPNTKFENWGKTVENNPSDTFVARTETGLCNLVKWAKQQGKKVRVAGYRHTWTDLYSETNEVLVMLLPLEYLVDLPAAEPTMAYVQNVIKSDLVGIEVPPTPPGTLRANKMTYCTVKAGTTNEMFREWCLDNRLWTLPLNVIMVEITMGGSNGSICHGAGFDTKTLSDLVAEFHYIDPNGNKKSISDPEQLKAASGCFGLLGICTAVTLRLEAMSKAVMNPVKIPLPLAIPPPVGYKIPDAIDMTGITPEKLEAARQDFIRRCKDDYYLEWFWFPLTDSVWINTWKKAEAVTTEDLKPYPSPVDALRQWTEGWLAQKVVSSKPFSWLPGLAQTLFLGNTALHMMPDVPDPGKAIQTLLSEALHFRRGTQNMRVWDSEWEIPIPESAQAPGERDYETIQRAWWDAISATYSNDEYPMRLTLEMRLTGGSEVLLAPQRGNKFGTVSIEVLTIPTTPKDAWARFMQQMADAWTSYTDSKGNLLNARPHWAKQWEGLTVRNQPIEKYLKQSAYRDAIPEFRAMLEVIAESQGTTVQDMRNRFGNPLLERLIFED
ncbi:unnamed protein product [Rhizoctonia solani]|uniref:FAD-binding PCMH-type domain-containing protein n=1 Tax=Rhizoctonia solani TaxID=456999 RepID=A0A8H3AHN1_9AGAM|nr:unnamed protein product [Rhizoctonia solani]CAE6442754.1 unnamed protein product [Rhizoctonia solani]